MTELMPSVSAALPIARFMRECRRFCENRRILKAYVFHQWARVRWLQQDHRIRAAASGHWSRKGLASHNTVDSLAVAQGLLLPHGTLAMNGLEPTPAG